MVEGTNGWPVDDGRDSGAAFCTTHWSVVCAASNGSSKQALESLCRAYWYPLYAFVRRRGARPEEAEDLTQAFFSDLLEKDALKTVAREKGKFRSFLLAAFTNFLNNEYAKAKTLKRGGRFLLESWDQIQAEERYGHEPVDHFTPEKLFERRWAFTIIEQVLSELRRQYQVNGTLNIFDELSPFLAGDMGPGVIAAAASRLGLNTGATKVALHRLRRRFGEQLRGRIAATVASPDQVDEELRYLLSVISA